MKEKETEKMELLLQSAGKKKSKVMVELLSDLKDLNE
jgi:hypothetical protein